MTNRSFERLVQDPAATDAVEYLEFGLELRHVPGDPLFHDRCVETAKLRNVEERPRALECGWSGRVRQPVLQQGPQLRQRAAESELSRRFGERRSLEQQPDREVSTYCH